MGCNDGECKENRSTKQPFLQAAASDKLNLIELFASVQGETSFAGLPTFFIRLAACNLRCRWCDTPYSFGKGSPTSFDTIFEQLQASGLLYVCITGGEPLLQAPVYSLMKRLCDEGYLLSLETGGSLSTERVDHRVKVILDIKCPASGMSHRNQLENIDRLRSTDEVKFVLANRSDYEWARNFIQSHDLLEKAPVLFSPVFEELEPKKLVEWMLADRLAKVRLNLQIHKFIWPPQTKGV